MRTYKDLAIAEEEDKLVHAIATSRNLLIEAPTGSGKSLYIPWFLSRHFSGRIVVLQPRRIAALALAQYSAKLHNEPCGKTVVISSDKTVASLTKREFYSRRTVTFYRKFYTGN